MRIVLLCLAIIALPAHAALPLLDTFTEGSDTALTSHTSDSSHSWSDFFPSFTVIGATDELSVSGQASAVASVTPGTADYFVEVTGKTDGTNPLDRFGAIARATGTEPMFVDEGYFFWLQGDGDWALSHWDANTETALDTGTLGGFSASTYYKVELQVEGTTLTAFIDDVQVAQVTDSSIAAAGNPGVYMRAGNARVTLAEADVIPAGGGTLPVLHQQMTNQPAANDDEFLLTANAR